MDLTGEYTIPSTRQEVWDALNDTDVLKVCVPGCTEMEKVSDSEFNAKITAKIGAVRAKLKGKVELSDIDAPNGYTMTGSGQGGIAGFAKGGAKVMLSDAPGGGTLLKYEAKAELGGKLAAVGSRVIQGVAKKMADDFFGAFARHLSGEVEEAPAASGKTAASAAGAGPASNNEGTPDWVKGAIVHSVITAVAVIAVAMFMQ